MDIISDIEERVEECKVNTEEVSEIIYKSEKEIIDELDKLELDGRKLVLILGAGISMSYGLKSWEELANSMIEEGYKEGKIDELEMIVLKKKRPKDKITIMKKKLKEKLYLKIIKKECYLRKESQLWEEENKKNLILESIKKINGYENIKYITTNVDRLLEVYLEEDLISIKFELKSEDAKIEKLHGCIEKEDIIFTPMEYIDFYGKEENNEKIAKLVKRSLVIFIGKELESEIIQAIVHERHDRTSIFIFKYYGDVDINELNTTIKLDRECYSGRRIKILPYSDHNKLPEYFDDLIGSNLNLISQSTLGDLKNLNIRELENRLGNEKILWKLAYRLKEKYIDNRANIDKKLNFLYEKREQILKISKEGALDIYLEIFKKVKGKEFIREIWKTLEKRINLDTWNLKTIIKLSEEISDKRFEKTFEILDKRKNTRNYGLSIEIFKVLLTKVEDKDELYKKIFSVEKKKDELEFKYFNRGQFVEFLEENIDSIEYEILQDVVLKNIRDLKNVISIGKMGMEDIEPFISPGILMDVLDGLNYYFIKDLSNFEYFLSRINKLSLRLEDELTILGYLLSKNPMLLGKIEGKKIIEVISTTGEMYYPFFKENKEVKEKLKGENYEKIVENLYNEVEKKHDNEDKMLSKFFIASILEDKKKEIRLKEEYKRETGIELSIGDYNLSRKEKLRITVGNLMERELEEKEFLSKMKEIYSFGFQREGINEKDIYIKYKKIIDEGLVGLPMEFYESLFYFIKEMKGLENMYCNYIKKETNEKNKVEMTSLYERAIITEFEKLEKDRKLTSEYEEFVERIYKIGEKLEKGYKDIDSEKEGENPLYYLEFMFLPLYYTNKEDKEKLELVLERINSEKKNLQNGIDYEIGKNLFKFYEIREKNVLPQNKWEEFIDKESFVFIRGIRNSKEKTIPWELHNELFENDFFTKILNKKELEEVDIGLFWGLFIKAIEINKEKLEKLDDLNFENKYLLKKMVRYIGILSKRSNENEEGKEYKKLKEKLLELTLKIIEENEEQYMGQSYLNIDFLNLCLNEEIITKDQIESILIHNFKKLDIGESSFYLPQNPKEVYEKIKEIDGYLAGIFIVFIKMSNYRQKEKLLENGKLIGEDELKKLEFKNYNLEELKGKIKDYLIGEELKIKIEKIKTEIEFYKN